MISRVPSSKKLRSKQFIIQCKIILLSGSICPLFLFSLFHSRYSLFIFGNKSLSPLFSFFFSLYLFHLRTPAQIACHWKCGHLEWYRWCISIGMTTVGFVYSCPQVFNSLIDALFISTKNICKYTIDLV